MRFLYCQIILFSFLMSFFSSDVSYIKSKENCDNNLIVLDGKSDIHQSCFEQLNESSINISNASIDIFNKDLESTNEVVINNEGKILNENSKNKIIDQENYIPDNKQYTRWDINIGRIFISVPKNDCSKDAAPIKVGEINNDIVVSRNGYCPIVIENNNNDINENSIFDNNKQNTRWDINIDGIFIPVPKDNCSKDAAPIKVDEINNDIVVSRNGYCPIVIENNNINKKSICTNLYSDCKKDKLLNDSELIRKDSIEQIKVNDESINMSGKEYNDHYGNYMITEIIDNKNILCKYIRVGDYTYYAGAYDLYKYWYDNCVLYLNSIDDDRKPSNVDKLSIGNFCDIASDVKFILGGKNGHDTLRISVFPFSMLYEVFGAKDIENWYLSRGDTIIGNDVWIGYGASIMDGVKIADGAIVAAKSHVIKDIGPYEIWGGNPAQLIKKRFTDDIIKKFLEIKWWYWNTDDIKKNVEYLRSYNKDDYEKSITENVDKLYKYFKDNESNLSKVINKKELEIENFLKNGREI